MDATSTMKAVKAALYGGMGIEVKFIVGWAFTVPEKVPVLGAMKNPAVAVPVIAGAGENLGWATTRVDAGAAVKGGKRKLVVFNVPLPVVVNVMGAATVCTRTAWVGKPAPITPSPSAGNRRVASRMKFHIYLILS
jgi:hypothetical protein